MTSAADSAAVRLARELSADDVAADNEGHTTPESLDAVLDELVQPPSNTAVLRDVDEILGGDAHISLPPERRARLVAAVDEALADRRRSHESLVNILRQHRRTEKVTLEVMASRLGELASECDTGTDASAVTADRLKEIEDGEAPLHAPDAILALALWSTSAGLESTRAVKAYRFSVRNMSRQAPLRSAAGRRDESDASLSGEDAVARFEETLQRLAGTGG